MAINTSVMSLPRWLDSRPRCCLPGLEDGQTPTHPLVAVPRSCSRESRVKTQIVERRFVGQDGT